MPGPADSFPISMPLSPPPPQSLMTYSRYMHDHTKRQMESFGAAAASSSPAVTGSRSSASSSLTNGVAPSDYQQ